MNALRELIDAYHAAFADSTSHDPDPLLIAAAEREQAELVDACRFALELMEKSKQLIGIQKVEQSIKADAIESMEQAMGKMRTLLADRCAAELEEPC